MKSLNCNPSCGPSGCPSGPKDLNAVSFPDIDAPNPKKMDTHIETSPSSLARIDFANKLLSVTGVAIFAVRGRIACFEKRFGVVDLTDAFSLVGSA